MVGDPLVVGAFRYSAPQSLAGSSGFRDGLSFRMDIRAYPQLLDRGSDAFAQQYPDHHGGCIFGPEVVSDETMQSMFGPQMTYILLAVSALVLAAGIGLINKYITDEKSDLSH